MFAIPIARAGLIAAAGLALSAQSFTTSSVAGIWAFQEGGCRSDGGHIQLDASGDYYSDCQEGTWSIAGSEIHVVVQNAVNDMCYGEPSSPAAHSGTILDVTPQTLTVRWHTTDRTITHTRCP